MHAVSAERYRAWAEGVRASDRAAFAALYESTYAPLHRYVWFITRDEDATDDVLQEVFIKLWNVRGTVDPDRSLKALLYQMARNFALNHVRSVKRRAQEPLEPDAHGADPSTDGELTAGTLERRLRVWIDELPPRRREAFRLSRFDGLSHDEIARVMALTPKTVNNHIVLALQTLRERLAHFDPDAFRDA